jgi:RNA polymerase sigma-70 factor (ECF subfamily)
MATETPSFKREMLSTLPSLRAFAVSLTGKHDKADDLVQDTVMKAWAKQSSFEMGTNIKAWLFTILRNEFYSQMRKRGREVQDTDGAFTERLSVHPSQYGSMDLEDFKKARMTSAKRSFSSAHRASPTKKLPRSAIAPWAP